MDQEPRFYWDNELEDDELSSFPYGDETARIIDLEGGGIIAYAHVSVAPAMVAALIATPPPLED